MAILQKLKSLLGIDDSGSEPRESRDVGVTVERERETPDEPEPAAEDETVATDLEGDADREPDDRESADEAAAAGGSAAASTDSLTEPTGEPESAAEPAEATGPTETDATPEVEKEPTDTPSEPVNSIKGIGPAYADRLAAEGVETVSDLATADAAALAEGTDISETRIQGWIDRAKVR
ncbi:helix-hairpin-helix domain-containing protein [Natrononativus amylolyticus]|uniref:helix-hairpin-helix domain-containing protein n=1 Tax=Natrononativus amylolyticus TaxID=2963434 RepID=UPI0020CD70C7|nr:helix-hairpin-helix domain-containing protein [Natrononativus amylolyticus]